jgi:hypothetical protein
MVPSSPRFRRTSRICKVWAGKNEAGQGLRGSGLHQSSARKVPLAYAALTIKWRRTRDPVSLIWYHRPARAPGLLRSDFVPCLLLFVILLFPRVALALMWFFSTYLQRAFHGGLVLPVLGFIFLPLTTIVYAWELNSGMPAAGINLVWLLIAVIIDLGGLGGGAHRQSRR